MSSAEVIIIGAGLAGLTCARRLQEAGRTCLVLEAADAVGGRVRTDVVDGFRLDRGFQVLLTAYPEARRWLDYEALDLQEFNPGALVRTPSGLHRVSDPFRRPSQLWATLRAPVGTLADKLRIATLRSRACSGSLEKLWARPETTALAALRGHGFGPTMIDTFLRPWLGGIFLDRDLDESSRMMEFVFRMFAEGSAAVPALGMQAIPEQLAAGLPPGTVRLNTRVSSPESGGVLLASGEFLPARHVVVACADIPFHGGAAHSAWRSTVALYFSAEHSPVDEATLCLNGTGRGRVNNLVVLSNVAPTYAPPGRALVSVTFLGLADEADEHLAALVRDELTEQWGFDARAWCLLRMVRVPRALPVVSSPRPEAAAQAGAGLWACGDHLSSASIQGAMESGRRIADAIILPG